jgi:hypothetical protein
VSVALVAGALANKPWNGGEAWVRMSWALGLKRLGFDVWFVEELDPASARDAIGRPVAIEESENGRWFDAVTKSFGLDGRSALVATDGRSVIGPAFADLEEIAAEATALVNISGNLTLESLLRTSRRRAYVDLDPGYTQFWHAGGHLGNALEQHDVHLTVGLALGAPGCLIPTGGIAWKPICPPALLDEWNAEMPGDESRFTTVGSWRGGYGRVEYEGRLLGQKAHEFRRFADLPRRLGVTCEAALSIDPADESDRAALVAGGWRLIDAASVAGDPNAYREFIQGSGAELSPAQGIYVETRAGWCGDRTGCYLASGRPTLVQDTGLPDSIRVGEGLLTFRDLSDAVAGVEAITSDYERHSRAARRLAEEHFDSRVVLSEVMEAVVA